MRTATSIQREASTLTPAQEAEMRRMDPNGDGIIDEKEGRAIARSSAVGQAARFDQRLRKRYVGSLPNATHTVFLQQRALARSVPNEESPCATPDARCRNRLPA